MTHLCQVDSGFWELEIARPVHLVEVQGGRRWAGGQEVWVCVLCGRLGRVLCGSEVGVVVWLGQRKGISPDMDSWKAICVMIDGWMSRWTDGYSIYQKDWHMVHLGSLKHIYTKISSISTWILPSLIAIILCWDAFFEGSENQIST